MKRRLLVLLTLSAIGLSAGTPWADGAADHVVLVSVDGLRPEFYLDRSWPAPTMQYMAAEGVRAERVRSVFPSVTYPSHTTMITGVMPARHGVLFNQPYEPDGQSGRWYWEAAAIQVPTLWDAVRESGLRSGAVSWPVSVGAPIDWMIPEVWSLESEGDRLAPMRAGTRPAEFWQTVEHEVTGRLDMHTYSSSYMSRDTKTGAIAAYILEEVKPALLALHLIGADHFQHEQGRDGDRVRRSVATADAALGALLEAAGRAGILDRTAFIVTGDHGFVDVHTVLAPNAWLAATGVIDAGSEPGAWPARFHTAGGAAFLRLRDGQDGGTVRKVRRVLEELPPGVRKLFRIVERDELDAIGADPTAPIALTAGLGMAFTASASGDGLRAGRGGTHGYFPSDFEEIYTGFVGFGAGFQEDRTIHEMGLEDVAPTIAALLGLEFSETAGAAPLGILTEAARTDR